MSENPQPDKPKEISSPERLLDILLMLVSNETVTVQEIADRFGCSRSSTYRDLGFLKNRAFLEEMGTSGTYQLGASIAHLASSRSYLNRMAQIAEPYLGMLADSTQESVLICRRSGNKTSLVVGVESRNTLRVSIDAADQQPLYRGSFGRVLLAYHRKQVIDSILSQPLESTSAKPLDPQAIRLELAAIRKRGFATSDSEIESGTRSIAVPVRWGKEIVASIAIAGPTARLPDARTKYLCEELTRTAHLIANDLYANPAEEELATPITSHAGA